MAKPRVSVIIATYNSGVYLRQAIDSILNQTMSDLELLVVDDGSTDGTRALVGGIADPRLHYIWQENAGQTAAKNRGIAAARGEFIAFCDGDDYWYANKLECQLPLLERAPDVGVVYSAVEIVGEQGQPLGRFIARELRGEVAAPLFLENFIPFGTAVVRRECIERMGAFDASLAMGIDWDLWLRLSTVWKFDYYPAPTYAYRIWPGQMSKNWRGRYSSAFRIMEKFMRENPGKISARLRRRAFANTFANRARARVFDGRVQAVIDGARAVALDPFEPYSWRSLARVLLKPGKGAGLFAPVDERRGLYRRTQRAAAPLVSRLTASVPRLFMYHRFSDYPQARACGIDEFRRQMLLLRERCRVVTLSELFDDGSPTHADARPIAVVTIDDGYADFHKLAFPLLQELGVQATVFVTTEFVSGGLWLWPDRIRALLETAKPGEYRLSGSWKDACIAWRSEAERERIWHFLADQLVFETNATRDRAIVELAESLKLPLDGLDMRRFAAMNWDALRELSAAGFEIGGHTCRHDYLPKMPDADVAADLARSKAQIEHHAGARVDSFAYPNGTANDYDARLIRHLKEQGYRQAVLSVPGRVTKKSRFELGRFSGDCSFGQFTRLVQGYGILGQAIGRS